jgi:hypothetical protein
VRSFPRETVIPALGVLLRLTSCWIGRWQRINRGDRAAATASPGRILAVDEGNAEAEDLLAVDAG